MACKQDVLALHAKGLTSYEIAERLACLPEYVRATLKRGGLASTRGSIVAKQRLRMIELEAALADAVYAFNELDRAYRGKVVRNLDERYAAVERVRKMLEAK